MSSVRGKVAVVTGAGSGIGRQLALELAKRGAQRAHRKLRTERKQRREIGSCC
jgi:NAD(P)-dependent dehydrogenase (short-subunit alcohol dehydrogenase family)